MEKQDVQKWINNHADEYMSKEMIDIIDKALEKQIPVKISMNNDLIPFCPICGCMLKSGTLTPIYCWHCGQRIDWYLGKD